MRASRSRGLSLIEVLIALAVLAISMLALVPLFGMSVKTNQSSSELSTANTLAREKLEELIGYPSTDPRLSIAKDKTIADPSNPGGATNYWANDLPVWFNPTTGQTSTATTSPGDHWFPYPVTRTYSVQAYRLSDMNTAVSSAWADESSFVDNTADWLATISYAQGAAVTRKSHQYISLSSGNLGNDPETSPALWALYPYYDVKLVTVSVQPSSGPFPGLRRTTQSAFLKYRGKP